MGAKAADKQENDTSVATPEQNADLEHSESGQTTRSDRLDAGVPMLPGSPSEPVGPEDALGRGPKRGDYSGRQDTTEHFQSVPNPDAGKPVTAKDDDGNEVVVDFEPTHVLEHQNPRVADVGDAEGLKGGVDTDPLSA